jgi:plasmid stabilization system protein ParE
VSRLIWSVRAQRDIEIIREYLGYDAAFEFPQIADRIVQAAHILIDSPFVGPVIGLRGERKWGVRGLPYILVYRPNSNGTQILRVRHSSENWRPVLL